MNPRRKPTKPSTSKHQPALIYARVSSKEQEKGGFSIPAQLKLLRDYAAANRLKVRKELTDVETAKRTGRTGFTAMLDMFRKDPNCRVLLVEKTDRLYRNLKDYVVLDELDLEIHFVKENFVLSRESRSTEKFMHGIKVLMAKNYIDNLGEEASKGMREKAEQGLWPSAAPLGYRNVNSPDGKRRMELDPVSAPLVTRMFEWYATGEHSLRELAKMVREAGLVFPRSNKALPVTSVHRILQNPIYAGEFIWTGKRYKGVHEPLVSRELWDKTQEELANRHVKKHRKVKYDFAFGRLITCGYCGCSVVGEIKKGRYIYYHCTGARGSCPKPYTREEVLEEKFTELLKGLTFDQEVIDWVADALRQSHADEQRFRDEAIARLREQYDKLGARIDAAYEDKLDGRIEVAYFDRMAGEWRAKQDRLLRAMEEHQNADRVYIEEGIQLLELAQRAHILFEKQPAHEKRRLLRLDEARSARSLGQVCARHGEW